MNKTLQRIEQRQAAMIVLEWVVFVAIALAVVLGPVLAFAGCSPQSAQAPRAVASAVERAIAEPAWDEKLWRAIAVYEAALAAYEAAEQRGESPDPTELVTAYCNVIALFAASDPAICGDGGAPDHPPPLPLPPPAPPAGMGGT